MVGIGPEKRIGPETLADRRRSWRPRLFAIDVDGTLLNSSHRLTAATIGAITRSRSLGAEILLASSRGPAALRPVAQEAGLTTPSVVVASQGAVTGTFSPDGRLTMLDRRAMPIAAALKVLAAAEGQGLAVNWFTADRWYVPESNPLVLREAEIVGVHPEIRALQAEQDWPDKLMLIATSSDVGVLHQIAAGLPPGLRAQVSNPTYLEITRDDVDKAEAVARYCVTQGIDRDDVVAIGDGPNDLGLLAYAGVSVAPRSARPEVLAAATCVTSSNDDDGVARALNALTR